MLVTPGGAEQRDAVQDGPDGVASAASSIVTSPWLARLTAPATASAKPAAAAQPQPGRGASPSSNRPTAAGTTVSATTSGAVAWVTVPRCSPVDNASSPTGAAISSPYVVGWLSRTEGVNGSGRVRAAAGAPPNSSPAPGPRAGAPGRPDSPPRNPARAASPAAAVKTAHRAP